MLRLATSNRLEALADALAEALTARASPLEQVRVAVPNRPIERFLEERLARRLGIASGLRFCRLPAALAAFLASAAGAPLLERTDLEARLLELFVRPGALEAPALAPVARWLAAGGPGPAARERREVALAKKLAELLAELDRTRPELVRAWLAGRAAPDGAAELAAWQAPLVRLVRAAAPAPGEPEAIFHAEALERLARAAAAPLPDDAPLHVLGVSTQSRVELAALGALARATDVWVYALDPCREFWEDVEAPRVVARRLSRAAEERAAAEPEAPEVGLLGGWGRPLREHLVVLRELAGWSADERWALEPDAPAPTLLSSLQRALLDRAPVSARASDGSVRVLGCPSVRREVETVAREIWAALAEADARGAPLAFHEIAVLLHDEARARYLPHVEAVFAEARGIPWTSRDLSLVGTSAVAQAALALVTLVASEPTRALLFEAVLSPVVLAAHPGATRERWAGLVDAVGFLRGLGPDAHAGTYVGEGAASLDLEQAIRRLALGALMPGERSGDARFVGAAPPLLPEEIGQTDEPALALVALLRSLAADARFARDARLSPAEWARFFGALVSAHVAPRTRAEEADLLRVRGALASLAALERPETRLGAVAAAELARGALAAATTQRSTAGAAGVAVGSLRALRAVPARLVFVLGLGEGRFPARDEESGLDVRDAMPRAPLDLGASERDRLAMLETVLAAREALVLSFVARAEDSGEPLSPSSVVLELLAELGPAAPEIERPPLRRHDGLSDATLGDRARLAALPAAVAEEEARALGDRERDPGQTWPRAADAVRGLAEGDGLRTLLSWPRLEPAPVEPGTFDVTLSELKAFLERPLQAAAERALGAGAGGDETEHDEEPLEAETRVRLRVVEQALTLHLRDPGPSLEARVAHEAELLRARGRFPLGVLGARARDALAGAAAAILDALGRARRDASLPPALVLGRARLGRGRRARAGVERVADPLALGTLRDGRTIALSGETGLVLSGVAESAALELGAPGADAAGELRRTRLALRAFVDHAALSAAGLGRGAARSVWLVHPGAVFRGVLEPIEPGAARAWLRLLASELARGHAAFLPVEAVLDKLDVLRGASSRPADLLHRSVERIRDKRDGGAERYGPVRDAVLYDGLDPTALFRAVGARFGPFVEHLRALEPVEPG